MLYLLPACLCLATSFVDTGVLTQAPAMVLSQPTSQDVKPPDEPDEKAMKADLDQIEREVKDLTSEQGTIEQLKREVAAREAVLDELKQQLSQLQELLEQQQADIATLRGTVPLEPAAEAQEPEQDSRAGRAQGF